MHSTLYYKDQMDRRYAQYMPKIQKLARLRDACQARGRTKDAAKMQARIGVYTIQMGETPRYIDRFQDGTQVIELFGLEWEEVAEDFTDAHGRMIPAHTLRLLSRLVAREPLFVRNARRVARWGLLPNPIKERRFRRRYVALRTFLETALERKEVLGVAA